MAVEDLSVFVERCLYPEVLKNESRIQDIYIWDAYLYWLFK